ncbi:hypothetical protein KEM48_003884 [Puccinia striiformis f. sp. tritici PST-130]|nr:hypothetical protein H4Q26_003517 [Puccinia striiformis f. sp. tritici PST-130]KAI9613250.1 hypothetical protein KEM48_003884 [Puccinia striiformis f. sp. tritici PST-130]KNF03468.1 hypothetical protein PSTG_03408 [Puccinia striiformis f. sp. tritici PST-78]
MTQTQVPPCIVHAFQQLKIQIEGLRQTSPERITDTIGGLEYFVKTTSSDDVVGETESLRALSTAAPNFVPKPLGIFDYEGKTVMISEYFDLSHMSAKLERSLARRLASMHDPDNPTSKAPNEMYGFDVSTHCGETEQDNTWEKNWMVFFRDRRIKSLLTRIGDEQITKLGNTLCDLVIPFLLSEFYPAPVPVIIHGDLWAGNISVNQQNGEPVLFDPSSYYGHNEVELGIMKMFGGRTETFFEEYYRHRPGSEPHHEERIRLYELYHHLNHTLMFGGSYRHGAIRIMNELINFVKKQRSG